MKVLVVYTGQYPGGMAMSRRLHLYSRGLIENGVEVVVAAVRSADESVSTHSIRVHESVPYYYIRSAVRKGNVIVRKLLRILDDYFILIHLFAISKRYDVVWSVGAGWFTNLLIVGACRLRKKRAVVEINEKPYSMIGGRFDSELLRRLNRWLFIQFVIKTFDGFVVISEALERFIRGYRKSGGAIIRIPVLIDQSQCVRRPADGVPFILHAGTLNEKKDGIVGVFRAVAEATRMTPVRFKFVLTNRASLPITLRKIDAIVLEGNLEDRVEFHNHLSEDELGLYMSKASLAIINKPDNDQNRFNFSSKLGEYWAYGVPLICTSVGEASKYLVHGVNCLIVDPDDIGAISDNIVALLENKDFAVSIGNEGRRTSIHHFDYLKNTADLRSFFETL